MSGTWLKRDLLDLPKGWLVRPSALYSDEANYVWRSDKRHALRQRLARLSKLGAYRMVSDDLWERM